jgi:RNA recognition motif-containing protein
MLGRAGVESVVRVNLPLDPQGRPRGFGFVILGSAEAAQAAVDSLRDAELKGRRVSASIAHARGTRPPRPPGGAPPMGGGGGGFSRPPREEPRWDQGGPVEPPPNLSSEEEGRGDGRRRGPKDTSKKKKGPRGPERGRNRRDGEGLRGPRARDWLDDKDDD